MSRKKIVKIKLPGTGIVLKYEMVQTKKSLSLIPTWYKTLVLHPEDKKA